MAGQVDIGIAYTVHLEQLEAGQQRALETLRRFGTDAASAMGGISTAAAAADRNRVSSAKTSAAQIINVNEEVEKRITAAREKRLELEKRYSGESTKVVLDQYGKHLTAYTDLQNALKDSTDRGVRDRIQSMMREEAQEKLVLGRMAKTRDEVINRGAGAQYGMLGIFRTMLASQTGMLPNFIGGGGHALIGSLSTDVKTLAGAETGLTASSAAMNIAVGGSTVALGAFATGAGLAIKQGSSMEDSLAKLSAQSGITGNDLDELRKKAEANSVKFRVDATDAVDGYRVTINALGLDLTKNIPLLNSMTDNVLTLAKASGMTSEESAGALGTAFNMFGGKTTDVDAAEKMSNIMNVLAAGARQARTQIPDLVQELAKVGPIAHQSNLSIEETVSLMETLGHAGIDVGESGNELKAYLMQLSSGSKSANDALSKLDLTYYDINPSTVGLSKSVHTLKDALDAVYDPTTKQGDAVKRSAIEHEIFQRRSSAIAEAVMNNIGVFDQYTKAVTGTSDATDMAAKMSKTFNDDMKEVWDKIKNEGVDAFYRYHAEIEKIPGAIDQTIPKLFALIDAAEKTGAAFYHVWELAVNLDRGLQSGDTWLDHVFHTESNEEKNEDAQDRINAYNTAHAPSPALLAAHSSDQDITFQDVYGQSTFDANGNPIVTDNGNHPVATAPPSDTKNKKGSASITAFKDHIEAQKWLRDKDAADQKRAQKASNEEDIQAEKDATEQVVDDMEKRGASEKEIYDTKRSSLVALSAFSKATYGEDSKEYKESNMQIFRLDHEYRMKQISEAKSYSKQIISIDQKLRDDRIKLIKDKFDRETEQENARYDDEKKKIDLEIADQETKNEQLEVLEQSHWDKIADIQQAAYQDSTKFAQELLQTGLKPITSELEQWIDKLFPTMDKMTKSILTGLTSKLLSKGEDALVNSLFSGPGNPTTTPRGPNPSALRSLDMSVPKTPDSMDTVFRLLGIQKYNDAMNPEGPAYDGHIVVAVSPNDIIFNPKAQRQSSLHDGGDLSGLVAAIHAPLVSMSSPAVAATTRYDASAARRRNMEERAQAKREAEQARKDKAEAAKEERENAKALADMYRQEHQQVSSLAHNPQANKSTIVQDLSSEITGIPSAAKAYAGGLLSPFVKGANLFSPGLNDAWEKRMGRENSPVNRAMYAGGEYTPLIAGISGAPEMVVEHGLGHAAMHEGMHVAADVALDAAGTVGGSAAADAAERGHPAADAAAKQEQHTVETAKNTAALLKATQSITGLSNGLTGNKDVHKAAGAASTILGALSAIPGVGIIPGIASAALSLFDEGGYTGAGGMHDAAGIVHRGEYVFSAAATHSLGVERLDRLHQHVLRGYADGGYVHTESNYVPHLLSIDSPSHSGGFGGASGGRMHPDDKADVIEGFARAIAKMPAPVFDRNALTDGVSQGGQRRTQLSWQ